jgi:hypothetical protein
LSGFFLTQRKQLVLSFLKVIFVYANPHHRHPMSEDSFRRKNSRIFHFSHYFTFSLRYFASRGPLRPFGFASLRQPDDFVAGASRLCVENKNLPEIIESTCSNFQNLHFGYTILFSGIAYFGQSHRAR